MRARRRRRRGLPARGVVGRRDRRYNIAAEPVLDPPTLARVLRARRTRVPARVLEDVAWRARLSPTPPDWLDMGLAVPVMDISRAREQLGWTPRVSATDALLELLEGMRAPAGLETPPLAPRAGGPLRSGSC